MAGTVVLSCTCKSDFQDHRYGRGKRVHNVGLKDNATCTVCGSRKSFTRRNVEK